MVECLPVSYLVSHCPSFPNSKTFFIRKRRSFNPCLFSSRSSFSRFKCSLVASPPSLPAEFVEFVEASKTGNLVPLFRCIFSDHLTPVLAYRCLVKENDWETPSFLFDSFEQGYQDSILGRYSMVGCEPSVEIVAKERRVIVTDHREGRRTEMVAEDPIGIPERIMEGWTPHLTHQLPDTFCAQNDAEKFAEASKKGNIVPLYRCLFSDHLTPVLAYRCLVKEDNRSDPSFLFESVQQNDGFPTVGRYSVVGAQPTLELVAKGNSVTIMDHEEGIKTEEIAEDPMVIPRRIMEGWKPQLIDELPEAFCGGWVGYFSYDTVRHVEKKKLPFSKAPKDDRELADIHLGLYDDVIVFDHVEKRAYVIHWVRLDRYSSVEKAYNDGMDRLEHLVSKVQKIDSPRLTHGSVGLYTHLFGSSLKKSTMTSEAYKEAVSKAKEHILSGDIFQIVLSQRFERRTFADPFEVYRALRVVNPSPYLTYIQARGCILVASSPEILTRVKKGKITNRPLAGTVRRGKTSYEDKMKENQLLNDEKQCAEHVMLVDLGRNDVGKVSKPGSVKVEKLMNIERYSHVMHISSTVTGELCDDLTCWDALRQALPVGTVSGAPKVKAMELIDQLEVTRRGPYSGGFGGISFTGDMDISLALRTIVFPTGPHYDTMYWYGDANRRQEWVAHLQAGAGIVADSVPDDEQKECENKAAALARAIELAESAFVEK